MGVITPSQFERAEMDAILRSGIFGKAPRLGEFFRYICERYFEGQADRIKEYSIAVEALGRPAEFDPKKDSIVRVEAHRLRKRLEIYYAGPGLNDPIRIVIPSGQYRPQFLPNESDDARRSAALAAEESSDEPCASTIATTQVQVEDVALPADVPDSAHHSLLRWLVFGLGVLVAAVAAYLGLRSQSQPATPASAVASFEDPGAVRILAGYRVRKSWTLKVIGGRLTGFTPGAQRHRS